MISRVKRRNVAVYGAVGLRKVFQLDYCLRPVEYCLERWLLLVLFVELVAEDEDGDGEHDVDIERTVLSND